MKKPSELETILHSAPGRTVVDALLQTTPSIAVIVDSEGQILRVSRHACELSGLRREELEGRSLEEFVALVEPRGPDGRLLKAGQFPLARALKGRSLFGRQGFFRDRHGERIPVVSNAAPFLGADGKVIGAISSVTDLRAFRALEASLRAAVAEKEMLYRELAHRVKNTCRSSRAWSRSRPDTTHRRRRNWPTASAAGCRCWQPSTTPWAR